MYERRSGTGTCTGSDALFGALTFWITRPILLFLFAAAGTVRRPGPPIRSLSTSAAGRGIGRRQLCRLFSGELRTKVRRQVQPRGGLRIARWLYPGRESFYDGFERNGIPAQGLGPCAMTPTTSARLRGLMNLRGERLSRPGEIPAMDFNRNLLIGAISGGGPGVF